MSNILDVNSRFSQAPSVSIQRSKFNMNWTNTTTMNAGDLVVLGWKEVLPGDTWSGSNTSLIRAATPIAPVMDDAYFDTFWFYVPNRILWDHWKEFMGENTTGPWTQTKEYSVPQLKVVDGHSNLLENQLPFAGTIWDYFALPTWKKPTNNISNELSEGFSVSALPFRAYVMIWNEFFRDQNVDDVAYFYTGDNDVEYRYWANTDGKNPENMEEWNKVLASTTLSDRMQSALFGGLPLKVNKFHDQFTSCLPQPQKGEPVGISLNAPVTTGVKCLDNSDGLYPSLRFVRPGYDSFFTGTHTLANYGNQGLAPVTNAVPIEQQDAALTPANLELNVDPLFTISELRTAFQLQKLLEAEARGGTRYRELLYSLFGVVSPDSRQQVPEYLGGSRQRIGMNQVVQTSSTDSTSPLGNVSAYSLTVGSGAGFSKSFTEHGILMCLGCIRTNLTYQQGIDRSWSRRDKYDFYFPQLANISEVPVYNQEIFAWLDKTMAEQNKKVFGYQEPWFDYRYSRSTVTGFISSNSPQPLDYWTYAQDYHTMPTLSQDWLKQGTEEIDRTLAVQSEIAHQFIADFSFSFTVTRPMPMYSIPGLADHH